MIPQQIDPPAQTKYRKILDPRFSKKRMLELAPDVRRHANELIDGFVARGECEFDREFAVPLPCTAFLSLMGLPQSELPRFLRIKDMIIRPQTLMENPTAEGAQELRKEAGRQIYAFFGDVIDQRTRQPGTDMVSYLLQTEIDGQRLSREDILDVSFLLILAGLDTVTATLGCNIAYLAANPEQRRRIVAKPAAIPGAVEELLRWETPVTAVPRIVKQEVEVHGVKLKKGEMVTLLLGASNVDAAEFEGPEQVDFARERNKHLAFGGGPHRCLGSHLARMELEVAMRVWHERIPEYRIKPGEMPRYSAGIREVQYLPLVWQRS
jgi:cytochrome P450